MQPNSCAYRKNRGIPYTSRRGATVEPPWSRLPVRRPAGKMLLLRAVAGRIEGADALPRHGCNIRGKQGGMRGLAERWEGGDGAPGEIRTPDLTLRRRSLYPAELRARSLRIAHLWLACAAGTPGWTCSRRIRSPAAISSIRRRRRAFLRNPTQRGAVADPPKRPMNFHIGFSFYSNN